MDRVNGVGREASVATVAALEEKPEIGAFYFRPESAGAVRRAWIREG